MITTRAFIKRLASVNLKAGDTLLREQVDFDLHEFVDLLPETGLSLVNNSEGLFSRVKGGGDLRDLSRSVLAFDYHTDGLYHRHVPQFVMLLCENPGSGLATTRLSDGRAALGLLQQADYEVLHRLETVYIGKDGRQHSQQLVQRHPATLDEVLLLGSRAFIRPFYEGDDVAKLPTLREILNAGARLLEAIDNSVIHEEVWQVGNALIFDNLRYLHCRFARGNDPERTLLRMWLRPNSSGPG